MEVKHLGADPRLGAYLVGGFGALLVAIVSGQSALTVLGAPFLALAALGVVGRRPAGFRGHVKLHQPRVIEGDIVEGEIEVDWDGDADVDVVLTGGRGVAAVEPAPVVGWSLGTGKGPTTLRFRLRARSWGVHHVGALWVRASRPGGLLVWEERLARGPMLRVLPTPLRLNRMLRPAEPRAVAGMHPSRLRGHGTDLAELRPYQPGDRLRDLSWATSARLGEPWVTVHHPERTGTMLLLLDAFFREEAWSTEALARAARAAWAVASIHLRAQDRVGLLAKGRTAAWIPPQGGRRARWLLLDELLSVGGAAEDRVRRRSRGGRVTVPADALVVGITSLDSRRFTRELVHYRRVGHTTVGLVIDIGDLLEPPRDRVDAAARRVWLAQREAERHRLERGGVPTVVVREGEGVGPAISVLRRRTEAVHRGRVGAAVR